MYLIDIDGAQKCSRMCICFEFLLQILRHKNAHVFPVGMVIMFAVLPLFSLHLSLWLAWWCSDGGRLQSGACGATLQRNPWRP